MRNPSKYMVTPISILSDSDFDYAYGVVTNGEKMLVVCTEGVSWEVRDDKPFDIGTAQGNRIFATRDGLDAMINSGFPQVHEPVGLHLWIREFGSRLESNYAQATWWLDQNFDQSPEEMMRRENIKDQSMTREESIRHDLYGHI